LNQREREKRPRHRGAEKGGKKGYLSFSLEGSGF